MSSKESKPVKHEKLPPDIIREFKNVVGDEWVSEDRAVVEAYTVTTICLGSMLRKVLKDPTLIPACVVLPSTTEEVQAIVKICNRYKIPFVPYTNGQLLCTPTAPKTVLIHLARMDKILYIDEKNMFMVIQPYVDYATIQAEARKRGLWNGGTGWHSAIAKPCSQYGVAGLWQTDLKYGGLVRNVLGFKIVLPTGEILNTGSIAIAGTGPYPFTERFPGPNLMGLFKSAIGSGGIITELTIKLHPWAGEPTLSEDIGRPSIATYFEDAKTKKFDYPPPPKNYKVYWFEYPNLESLVEGVSRLAASGIGIGLNITGEYNATMCSKTSEEAEKRMKEGFFSPYQGYIVLAAITSKHQLEYEEKVFMKILEETGGKLISKDYKPEVLDAVAIWNLEFSTNTLTGMRTVRSGYIATVLPPLGPFTMIGDGAKIWCDLIERFGATTVFSKAGCNCPYGYIVDRGHQITIEADQFAKRYEIKHLGATISAEVYSWPAFMRKGYWGGMFVFTEPMTSCLPEIGPNLYMLLRKFREVFDPNGLAAGSRRVVWSEDEFKARLERRSRTLEAMLKAREEYGLKSLKLKSDGKSWEYP